MSCHTHISIHTHTHTRTRSHTRSRCMLEQPSVLSLPFPGYRESGCLISQSAASLVVTEFGNGWRRSEGGVGEKGKRWCENDCFLFSLFRNFTVFFSAVSCVGGISPVPPAAGFLFLFFFITRACLLKYFCLRARMCARVYLGARACSSTLEGGILLLCHRKFGDWTRRL